MNKIAYVFPGQGSQSVGMGQDIALSTKVADITFEKANQELGFDLKTLCFEGPEEELKQTYYTQPALLTTSIALYEAGKDVLPKPDYVAGHSLGEYTALVVAGAMKFEDAVTSVYKRGQLMNEAVPSGLGAMAAVMGGEKSSIQEICQQVAESGHPVQMANINCPGQIVISGTKEGVQQAAQQLKEQGVKRVIELMVSGPFHSELMKPAAHHLKQVLASVAFSNATIPVVRNIDAVEKTQGEELKDALIQQVYSSVLWEESIQYMIEQGVDTFIEIGSGKVLTGLIKKIDRNVTVLNIYDTASLAAAKEQLEVKA